VHQIPTQDLSAVTYVLTSINQGDGAAFAEITKAGKLSYLGRLPQQSKLDSNSIWREIKRFVLLKSWPIAQPLLTLQLQKLHGHRKRIGFVDTSLMLRASIADIFVQSTMAYSSST
jgi:hypothetical protein